MKRPEINYDDLVKQGLVEKLTHEVMNQIDIHIKYEGYIQKQLQQVEKFNKLENKLLPTGIDYQEIKSLSREAVQKLSKIKPLSVGQASRISGVSPADIAVLLVYLEKRRRSVRQNEL